MALHAVFQALGLEVDVRPVLPDITECYKEVKDSDDESEEESEEELVPLVGRFRPGRVDIVREGGYYGDIRDWVEGYFDYRHDVTWITSHKYGGLGMVHLTVKRRPPTSSVTDTSTNAFIVRQRNRS